MVNNMFFEQKGRAMYGNQFGYAVEYELTKNGSGIVTVCFKENLVMPDDPQNWKMPMPIDLVSECIFEMAQKNGKLIVQLYGRQVTFGKDETLFNVKKRIREIQKSLVKVESDVSNDVRHFIQNGIFDLIRWMPVH